MILPPHPSPLTLPVTSLTGRGVLTLRLLQVLRQVREHRQQRAQTGLNEHDLAVGWLTVQLATKVGLLELYSAEQVFLSGLLHDLGKTRIPTSILDKPGPLTADEREVMQTHPHLGYLLAQQMDGAEDTVLKAILHHHERFDGTGYPVGLVGHSIPILARVICVVDVYHSLISRRPYREAWSQHQAISFLHGEKGKMFDPQVVDAFLEHVIPPA